MFQRSTLAYRLRNAETTLNSKVLEKNQEFLKNEFSDHTTERYFCLAFYVLRHNKTPRWRKQSYRTLEVKSNDSQEQSAGKPFLNNMNSLTTPSGQI